MIQSRLHLIRGSFFLFFLILNFQPMDEDKKTSAKDKCT